MRKRKFKHPPLTLADRVRKARQAGLGEGMLSPTPPSGMPLLPDRIEALASLFRKPRPLASTDMYCLISYDIEHNRVRRLVAKYLMGKGCIRVQKSVYFARLERKLYRQIVADLAEIQAMYDNEDSIFFLPVGEDVLSRMEVVGHNFYVELVTDPPSTFFF